MQKQMVNSISPFNDYSEQEKLIGRIRKSSAMKMAKTKLKNVIDDTTMKMAKSNLLKIKIPFFEKGFVVSYIYVLGASVPTNTTTIMQAASRYRLKKLPLKETQR